MNIILLSPSHQFKLLTSIKNPLTYIKPIGKIHDISGKYITGFLTSSGLIIPTTLGSTSSIRLPVIYQQFVDNIDTYLYSYGNGNGNILSDDSTSYMSFLTYYTSLYYRFKYSFSTLINLQDNINYKNQFIKLKTSSDNHILYQNLIDIIMKSEVTFINKTTRSITNLQNHTLCSKISSSKCSQEQFCKNVHNTCLLAIERELYYNFLKKLSLEIVWNTDILSGNINKEYYSKDNFIKRKHEILLLTNEDIKRFFFLNVN